ncbi:MAG: bL21 family ribosomal protein, partial [Clostridia bacterium]|nr:bL21 family ribosomal protein [Clostridia bacterium]
MYAIVKTGGKQYKVTEGLVFETELLNLDVDSTLELEVVLAANEEQVFAGEETKQVKVLATVVEH